jgi:hypothetical protein
VPDQLSNTLVLRISMVTRRFRWTAACAAALALTFVTGRSGSASVILDTNGFEAPAFDTTFDAGGTGYAGQLEGQPIAPPEETWQQAGTTTSRATVRAGVGVGGTQAVEVTRIPDSGDIFGANGWWGVPTTGLPASPTDILTVSWDMNVLFSGGAPGQEFGPFFGVQAYADPLGGNTVLGALGVDATTGDVLVQDAGGVFVEAGLVLSSGVYNSFSLVLDYGAQQYSVLVNNILLLDGLDFVDGPLTAFSDASITTQNIDFTADPRGAALFDNFVITAVPELSTGVIWLGLATVAAGGYWKRSRAKG